MPESIPAGARARAPVAFGLVLLAAGGIFAVTMGARQSMGLFLSVINTTTGLGLASISLAFGVGQLWWGLTQPLAGIVADRYGAGRVVLFGLLLVALGTALVPLMTTTFGLIVAIGVLAAGGAGFAGPSVLLSATARLTPPARRGIASGIVNAGGSFGQFVFVPIAQGITAIAGWAIAIQSMAAIVLLALPAAWVLRGSAKQAAASAAAATPSAAPARAETTREAIGRAMHDPSYLLLAAGFFVCGFHVAFIATHLPGVVAACQLPPAVGAWALAIVGLFNIVGSFAMGWAVALQSMAAIVLLALPAAWVLRGSARQAAASAAAAPPSAAPVRAETTREAIRRALQTPGYLLLAAGFFVCGFHVAFIATHLPGVVAACQLPPAVGAWALAIVGLFNIVGSFAIGWALGRWRMKSLLSLIYAARGLAVLAFLFAPKTEAVVLVFAAVIGLTYLSTVPPTAGLVAKFFGTAHMATLFGFVMLSHQIGGFLGAWLGGKAFEWTGRYDWMWYADIVLAAGAALIHLPIREAPVPARVAAAAA